MLNLHSILCQLKPYTVSNTKIKAGDINTDGAYICLDHKLNELEKVYSYGIGGNIFFDKWFADRGVLVEMFDKGKKARNTIIGSNTDQLLYNRQNLTPRGLWDTIINKQDVTSRKILKIDIEGAEWDCLDSMNITAMTHFEQICIEYHFYKRFDVKCLHMESILKRLNQYFNIVHVHANNAWPIRRDLKLPIPNLLEVTYARKDICKGVSNNTTKYPTEDDIINVPGNDSLALDFFPFI